MHTDTFACKIRGLRQKQTTQSHFEDVEHDDGTRKIQIPNESKVSKPKPVFGPEQEKRCLNMIHTQAVTLAQNHVCALFLPGHNTTTHPSQ